MEYKYVTVLPPKQVRDLEGKPLTIKSVIKDSNGNNVITDTGILEKAWTTYSWLEILVFSKEEWEKPLSKHRIANRISNLFITMQDIYDLDITPLEYDYENLKEVAVLVEDWREVRDFLESDDYSVPSPHNRQLYSFADAWLRASDVPREELKKPVIEQEVVEEVVETEKVVIDKKVTVNSQR